jgi:hypothetical protein
MKKNIRKPTLKDFQQYTGLHCHKLWKEVGENFVCPACNRNKFQILRWTTRFPRSANAFEDWVAVLHRHHDHSDPTFERTSGRFPVTVICDQCNAADGAAKRKLGLPKSFSFSPLDISHFVVAAPHAPHQIDFDRAKDIYLALQSAR